MTTNFDLLSAENAPDGNTRRCATLAPLVLYTQEYAAMRCPFCGAIETRVQKALEKRAVSVELIDEAIARVKHRCLVAGEREIDSRQIGEWVMEELRKLDQVAYIRFASVYRRFEDVAAFREAIETLEQTPETAANQLSLLQDGD